MKSSPLDDLLSSFTTTLSRRRDRRRNGAVWNGYLLTVACPCGVVFQPWITPEDADADFVGIDSVNGGEVG
jgi:hypothetical protein